MLEGSIEEWHIVAGPVLRSAMLMERSAEGGSGWLGVW